MANSGIAWIDTIFDWAVIALYQVAGLMGITYEEINVWLFCVAWPVVTLVLAYNDKKAKCSIRGIGWS